MTKFDSRSPGQFSVVRESELAAVLEIEQFGVRMPLQGTRPAARSGHIGVTCNAFPSCRHDANKKAKESHRQTLIERDQNKHG